MNELAAFIVIVLLVGIAILLPSYFEKRIK
jgi:hypothetical protein